MQIPISPQAPQRGLRSQPTKVQQIAQLFERFGNGDIAGILTMCSEDCDWMHGGNPAIIPYARTFRGRAGVAAFFDAVGKAIEVSSIRPDNYRELGSEVSHDFHVEATVRATGKPYIVDARYIWTFNPDGLIGRFRGTGDFTAVEAAFRP